MDRLPESWLERRDRYLGYAADAEAGAFRCTDARLREAYVNIAKSWATLAQEHAPTANDEREPASSGAHSR